MLHFLYKTAQTWEEPWGPIRPFLQLSWRSNRLPFLSFRRRLLFTALGLLVAALAAFGWLAEKAVMDQVVQDATDRARHGLQATSWLLADQIPFREENAMDSWLTGLAERLGLRLTYVRNGKVLADSEVPTSDLADMEDHSGRPEILAALRDGEGVSRRHSSTLGRDMIYVAMRLDPGGDVLRAASPFSEVQDRINGLRWRFFLLLLAILAVGGVAGQIISSRLTRSVTLLSETAKAIGRGEYARRIRIYPGGEFKGLAESVNEMAEEIESHIKTIESQKGQLRALFDNMADGIMVIGETGRITAVNKAFADMYPQTGKALGRFPVEAVVDDAIQRAVDNVLAHGELASCNIQTVLPDGRPVDVAMVPYQEGEGPIRIILVFHDMSEALRNEHMLRDFMVNLSHQIRTPLTAIRGYAETLADLPPKDEEAAARFLGKIVSNAQQMQSVISGMLTLAKSEKAGREESRTVLEEAVRQAVQDLEYAADTAKVCLRTEGLDGETLVHADQEALVQALANLLENAVRHSPEGSEVLVSASLEGNLAVLSVRDHGPGIPRHLQERIFEPFFRTDPNPIVRGGAGLGLSICRTILAGFGATVKAASPPEGSGALFLVRLKPS